MNINYTNIFQSGFAVAVQGQKEGGGALFAIHVPHHQVRVSTMAYKWHKVLAELFQV